MYQRVVSDSMVNGTGEHLPRSSRGQQGSCPPPPSEDKATTPRPSPQQQQYRRNAYTYRDISTTHTVCVCVCVERQTHIENHLSSMKKTYWTTC